MTTRSGNCHASHSIGCIGLSLALLAGCSHLPPGEIEIGGNEPPPPVKNGIKIAPRAFDTTREILEQTAAVVEGDVSDVSFDYDDCAGPRTKLKVTNTRTLLGTTVSGDVVLSVFGGPLPNGKWVEASEMPQFALGARYLFFLRNTDWTFAPIIGDLAYRHETIAGEPVLVSQLGQAVTGMFESGIETNTVPLTEPTGTRHRALRPSTQPPPRLTQGASMGAPTTISTEGEPNIPPYGPSPREIIASERFARPAVLPNVTPAMVKDALTPAAFVDTIAQHAGKEQVRLGGYLALAPLWRCWGVTPTQGKRGALQ